MAFLGRYAPGLQGPRIGELAPEETAVVKRHLDKLLEDEADERTAHTKAAMRAAASSRVALF